MAYGALNQFRRDIVKDARENGFSDSAILPLVQERFEALLSAAVREENGRKKYRQKYLELKKQLRERYVVGSTASNKC